MEVLQGIRYPKIQLGLEEKTGVFLAGVGDINQGFIGMTPDKYTKWKQKLILMFEPAYSACLSSYNHSLPLKAYDIRNLERYKGRVHELTDTFVHDLSKTYKSVEGGSFLVTKDGRIKGMVEVDSFKKAFAEGGVLNIHDLVSSQLLLYPLLDLQIEKFFEGCSRVDRYARQFFKIIKEISLFDSFNESYRLEFINYIDNFLKYDSDIFIKTFHKAISSEQFSIGLNSYNDLIINLENVLLIMDNILGNWAQILLLKQPCRSLSALASTTQVSDDVEAVALEEKAFSIPCEQVSGQRKPSNQVKINPLADRMKGGGASPDSVAADFTTGI